MQSSVGQMALPLVFLFPQFTTAYPNLPSAHDIVNSTLHSLLPTKANGTITDELSCYSLPYGGIGFAGHVLTYWTVAFLVAGRRPIQPWKDLKYQKMDLVLDALSLILSVPFAILTIVRCLGTWQYVLLAIWKTTLAVSLSAISFQRSWSIPKDTRNRKAIGQNKTAYLPIPGETYSNYDGISTYSGVGSGYGEVRPRENNDQTDEGPGIKLSLLWWLILYALGTIIGLTGLFSIVRHTYTSNHVVRQISSIFLGVAIGPSALYMVIVVLVKIVQKPDPNRRKFEFRNALGHTAFVVISLILWAGMLAAFYSDWVLGAVTGNLVGTPDSSNKMVYWTYFIAKRIPLFSF